MLSQEIEEMDKLSSSEPEREQMSANKVVVKMPSRVGRIPVKITGTDIESMA